jgi:hypothetical protein
MLADELRAPSNQDDTQPRQIGLEAFKAALPVLILLVLANAIFVIWAVDHHARTGNQAGLQL